MLCMVLVICNSVSILADAPAAATTTTEKQVKETGTAKSEGASEEEQSADDEKDTSEQSDEESAPETETTEKKEETTEATTEDKEDATTEATTKAKEETTEATETSDKDETTGAEDDSDKKDETSEISEEETSGTSEETKETTEEETDKENSTEAKDETAVSELTYTNDDVVITVSEVAEGAIPEGAELKVVPILKDDADTQTQYAEVEEKIQEKAAETETEIAGFLAYDITFVDKDGNEIEPNSEVKVEINYKSPSIPVEVNKATKKNTAESTKETTEEKKNYDIEKMSDDELIALIKKTHGLSDATKVRIDRKSGQYKLSPDWLNYPLDELQEIELTDETQDAESAESESKIQVTVMHLEENKNGTVQKVVDLSENGQLTAIDTTEGNKIQKTEFVTDSFSAYSVVWKKNDRFQSYRVTIHASYGYINENGYYVEFSDKNGLKKIDQFTGETRNKKIALSDYSNASKYEQGGIYEYEKAVVSTRKQYSLDAKEAVALIYDNDDDNEVAYTNINGSETKLVSLSKNNTTSVYIYYVYQIKQTTDPGDYPDPDPTPSVPQLGEPDHQKTIAKNNDGSYTIALDVTGAQEEPDPIDVLLIIDRSGSMADYSGQWPWGGYKYQNVNSAITTLKTELSKAETDVNVAAITFSGAAGSWISSEKYKDDSWLVESWTDIDNFSFELTTQDGDGTDGYDNRKNCSGGTNWQAAIQLAEETLSSRINSNPNSKKVVVFLTDGDPTYYYSTDDWGRYTAGNGQNESIGTSYAYAKAELQSTRYLKNSDYVTSYVVDATENGSNNCTNIAKLFGNGQRLMGNDPDKMQESFGKIASDILTPAYKNVVINDTLSDYVQFAELNPTLQVYAHTLNDNGEEIGNPVRLVEEKDYTKTIDKNTKKISVNILKGEELPDNVLYRVSFDVIPVTNACLSANGYNATGEEGTDINDWYDSSPDKNNGFYSNVNNEAYVEYQENDNEKQTALYQKPIIQIDKVSKTVNKVWEDTLSSHPEVTVVLTAEVPGKNVQLNPLTQVLNDQNGWTYTWNTLPKYYYDYDANGRAERTEIQYTITEQDVEGYTAKYSLSGTTTTITNVRDGELTVIKNWSDAETIEHSAIYVALYKEDRFVTDGADNVLAVELSQANNWTASFTGLGELSGYTVKEMVQVENQVEGTVSAVINGQTIYLRQAQDKELFDDRYYSISVGDVQITDNYHGTVTLTNTAFVYSLKLQKEDSLDSSKKLTGAQFTLYTDQTCTQSVEVQITGENGILTFTNLQPGTYYLKETEAPEGYTMLSEVFAVTIDTDGKISVQEIDKNGEIVQNPVRVSLAGEAGSTTSEQGLIINNCRVYELPESGGPGIYWYTLSGTLLMAGAVLIVYRQKRKREVLLRK